MTPESWFVDTNILVYATYPQSPLREIALARLHKARAEGTVLAVSTQVLREYLAAAGRSSRQGLASALENVKAFRRDFLVLEDSLQVSEKLTRLIEEHPTFGHSVHDANIVACMMSHGIQTLLTNNPKDFAKFSGLIKVVELETGTVS